MEVYLDNSATTRVFPEVAELRMKIMVCKIPLKTKTKGNTHHFIA